MLRSARAFRWLFKFFVVLEFSASLVDPVAAPGQGTELRALWVDAYHPGFKSAAEVTTLIDDIRSANCNAVFVELRKRGDAYYIPNTAYPDYEPHATDTTPPNFDPLAEVISKAHDTNGSKPRIEVHAWLVTWPIWGNTNPPTNPQHPLNRHRDWLTQDNAGSTWNGQSYCLDPGHPGALEHTFRIAINLVTNYDIDGLNFDYIRYAANTWGYNPTAVSRFHAQFGGSGNPANSDPDWLQFRRDQVTAFLRKVYLNAIAAKPKVKISADTITWAPGPDDLAAWYSSSAAWNNVLQDWRGWLEEGILDLNVPMIYFDQAGPYAQDWTNWCNFARDQQYNRQMVIGVATYLNSTADALRQIRFSRTASAAGNYAHGLCCYSYATLDQASHPFKAFESFLTNSPNRYDPVSPAVFATPAAVPSMPWKTQPTRGHIMGTVLAGDARIALDAASLSLSGPVARKQTTDGTGFYGFVDLSPGDYTLQATAAGWRAATNSVTITAGVVTSCNFILEAP